MFLCSAYLLSHMPLKACNRAHAHINVILAAMNRCDRQSFRSFWTVPALWFGRLFLLSAWIDPPRGYHHICAHTETVFLTYTIYSHNQYIFRERRHSSSSTYSRFTQHHGGLWIQKARPAQPPGPQWRQWPGPFHRTVTLMASIDRGVDLLINRE
jgi:hypothetical protein